MRLTHRGAERRMAGLVMPWMLSRRTAVALGAALAQSLTSLAASRHDIKVLECCVLESDECVEETRYLANCENDEKTTILLVFPLFKTTSLLSQWPITFRVFTLASLSEKSLSLENRACLSMNRTRNLGTVRKKTSGRMRNFAIYFKFSRGLIF